MVQLVLQEQEAPALCFRPGQLCGGTVGRLSLRLQPCRWLETLPGWRWLRTELFDRNGISQAGEL